MDGIPADFMSLFPMPEKWKGNWIGEGAIFSGRELEIEERCIQVKWNIVTSNKQIGGLGVKNLNLRKKSLL